MDIRIICHRYNIEYKACDKDTDIDNTCDEYLITGTGILSKESIFDKKIINCHPGIIPISRVLDSFKWSVYYMRPVENTLHYIDENVDSGTIISVISTSVFETDTLESFARRHYEMEIKMLSDYQYLRKHPNNAYQNAEGYDATMHMPYNIETEIFYMFEKYKALYTK